MGWGGDVHLINRELQSVVSSGYDVVWSGGDKHGLWSWTIWVQILAPPSPTVTLTASVYSVSSPVKRGKC